MEQNSFRRSPMRQSMIKYLEHLADKINDMPTQNITNLFFNYVNYCKNMGVVTRYEKFDFSQEFTFTDKFKQELLSDIENSIAIAKTKTFFISTPSVMVNNNNSQEQNQIVTIKVIEDAFRESLTGGQYDKIQKMIRDKSDKKSFGDYLASLGKDVLSGVLSNIITSTMI